MTIGSNAVVAFVLHLTIFMWISWIYSNAFLLDNLYIEKLVLLSILSLEV